MKTTQLSQAFGVDGSDGEQNEFTQYSPVASWSDADLISAVRLDPPDEAALDVLVDRYWDSVFARCWMLTLNHEKARDLAQAAWCRLLRARHTLDPAGNFPAYLATIATNLFRDAHRLACRRGKLADLQLASLNATIANTDGEVVVLESDPPDPRSLRAGDQARLKMDVDAALQQLTPRLREVLVAHCIAGESCARIGLRYGRSEQTISGWVRDAIRRMKVHLEDYAA